MVATKETNIRDEKFYRGLSIANRKNRVQRIGNRYKVLSDSGRSRYIVSLDENGYPKKCTCSDHIDSGSKCKHMYAVELVLFGYKDENGVRNTIKPKKSYPQDWKVYDEAHTNEGNLFLKLLYDLCSGIPNPKYSIGRPALPMADMIFCSALKVYSTFSLRRFVAYMKLAESLGYIDNVCSFVTISNYMKKPEMANILRKLIKITSIPLCSIESDFAVDASGFGTSRFARYMSYKHGKEKKYRYWIKCHLISGVKTNIVTGAEVSREHVHDTLPFRSLVRETHSNFEIREISADKAYSSRSNLEFVDSLGGTAYIPFKKTTSGKARGSHVWKTMYHYFQYRNDEFRRHYHKRSNSETVFHMIKSKFHDSVKSKHQIAQANEVLLKVLCHNICVLIQQIYELGINPELEEVVKKVLLNSKF